MKIITTDQRTPEWITARLGMLTGTGAADILATIKSGEAASRRNLRVRLMLERITGRSLETGFVSAAMQTGIEREADAVALYEALTGTLLNVTGFVAHDSLMAGCSPDGYLGDWDGIVEVKSPQPAAHLDYLRTGVIPDGYQKQIIHNLWITGAQWCDWLSFNPDFPEPLQVKLVRVVRDETQMKAYELAARMFLAEVDKEVAAVQQLVAVAV